MRHLIIYIYACAMTLMLASCREKATVQDTEDGVVDTIPVMVSQLKQCSRLYTAEYKVHKIVTHDDVVALSGKALG